MGSGSRLSRTARGTGLRGILTLGAGRGLLEFGACGTGALVADLGLRFPGFGAGLLCGWMAGDGRGHSAFGTGPLGG
jgi:hypothetical protein